MTIDEFNEKYKDYIEEGHYGLAISSPEFIEWLDGKFQEFIKNPDFSFTQIKSKFGFGRFYCKGVSSNEVEEVELKINELCQNKKL